MKRHYPLLFLALIALILTITRCGNRANHENKATDTASQNVTTDTINQNAAAPVDSAADKFASGPIAIEQLPASVNPYVEKNFPGYKIANAAYDPLCSGGNAIDVVITKRGQANLSLIFIPDGTFVQKEEDVPLNTAPNKVRDVVKTKYSDYKAANQIEKITLADNTTEYLIDIAKGNVSKEVIMATDGTVICEN
jgi:hypothetical protein